MFFFLLPKKNNSWMVQSECQMWYKNLDSDFAISGFTSYLTNNYNNNFKLNEN